mgnify:CR=1 FL=1
MPIIALVTGALFFCFLNDSGVLDDEETLFVRFFTIILLQLFSGAVFSPAIMFVVEFRVEQLLLEEELFTTASVLGRRWSASLIFS